MWNGLSGLSDVVRSGVWWGESLLIRVYRKRTPCAFGFIENGGFETILVVLRNECVCVEWAKWTK